jgi:glycosyltransferase involved in cell wall biosynthesis
MTSTRYKIALVCDWYLPQIGGIELHLRNLARELVARGHEVQIITTLPGPLEIDEIKIHRLSARLLPGWNILLNRKPFRFLKELLIKENFDILHAHSGVVSPLAYGTVFLAHRLGIPTVLTNHSLLELSSLLFRSLNFFSKWTHWPVVLTSVSHTAAQGMRRASGRKEIPILPNGIRPEEWEITPQPRKELQITSVMRLNRKKRPLDLIRVLPEIHQKLPHSMRPQLTLIGDGPYRHKVEREIRRLQIERYVELKGYQPRSAIKKIFEQTDLFVSPGRKESFGIAVLEARSAGLPVVAMNEGGVRELIQQGKQGLLANTREEFVNFIVKLLIDRPLRNQMAENTKKGVEQFGWDSVIAKHLEVYQWAFERAHEFYAKEGINDESLPHHRYGTGLSSVSEELPRN